MKLGACEEIQTQRSTTGKTTRQTKEKGRRSTGGKGEDISQEERSFDKTEPYRQNDQERWEDDTREEKKKKGEHRKSRRDGRAIPGGDSQEP